MSGSTALEVLIAEMLGDIGKLHDAVQELKSTLPHEFEAAEERIVAIVGLLNQAGDGYRRTVKTFTASELGAIRVSATSIHKELEQSVQRTLAEVPRMINTSIESALSMHLRDALKVKHGNGWVTTGICVISAVVGATLALVAVTAIH